jgi:hypothetical protein
LAAKLLPIVPIWANSEIIAKENNVKNIVDSKSTAHV